MLFSRPDVATFVNDSFEPVWESVRPVPIVRVDFGNGTTLTRTLHGNIATYVCTSRGEVLDVLPGIYTPAAYRQQLNQLRLLAAYVGKLDPERRAERLRTYHAQQVAVLNKWAPRPQVMVGLPAPITKAAIERPLELMVMPGPPAPGEAARDSEVIKFNSPEDLADWKLLAEDVRVNEGPRRIQIHNILASGGPFQPSQVSRRIYKEVLHADLDDPYLGLGSTLFASYPFKDNLAH